MGLGGDGRDGGDGRELVSSGVGCRDDEGEVAVGESGRGGDWGWGGAPRRQVSRRCREGDFLEEPLHCWE